jgi:hypothetical protein
MRIAVLSTTGWLTYSWLLKERIMKSMWQKPVSVVLLLMVCATLSVGFPDRLKKTAQRSTPGCPSLRIEAPNAEQMSQDTWTFSAVVEGFDSKAELTYMWTVDQGKINSGQGTAAITIDRPDLQKGILIVVDVGGFPEGCGTQAKVSIIS